MQTVKAYQEMVESALKDCLRTQPAAAASLVEAMEYSLLSGGKRIRPILLLASCEMGGGTCAEAMPYALALEMIHTYSCIHDDLPAMDDDALRRNRPTNHVVYGEAMAILAGDGLLTEAGAMMLRDAMHRSDLRGTRAAEAFLRRAGIAGMVSGQVMDMQMEGKPIDRDAVTYIHTHKTADLLTAPLEAGLILAGCGDEAVAAGICYGQHLGLAFQQMDDLLDVIGDTESLGKQVGMDALEGKQTWVALRGVEGTREDIREETLKAVDALACFGERAAFLQELAMDLTHRVR